MSKKKFDTSWFNLKNYQEVKNLDLYGWYRQLVIRGRIKSVLLSYEDIIKIEGEDRNDIEDLKIFEAVCERDILGRNGEWQELYADPALRWVERIKNNPIIDSDDNSEFQSPDSHLKYPFNTYSVSSTSAYFIYRLTNDYQLTDVWNYCKILDEEMEVTNKQAELINTPYDLLCIDHGIENEGQAHVTVDLTATDEQIKQDFCHWLSEFRSATQFQSNKKNFTNTMLSDWGKVPLLPYIDLMLIAKIEGKKISNPEMAELIYSNNAIYDDNRNPESNSDSDSNSSLRLYFTEKVRRTIQGNAEKLIRETTLAAIETQLHSMSQKRST